MEPIRISFPDLEQSFPRLERYLRKLRQATSRDAGVRDAIRQWRGEKVRQHWNWWILPVAAGGDQRHKGDHCCGSSTSRKFALESLYEAIAFLCHPELGKRFFWSIQWIRDQVEPQGRRGGQGCTLNEIFGETDAKKVRCSVTLFRRLAGWCYSLSPASYATLIANCDAILVAASRDGHRSCDHVPELYREFEESLEDPREQAKMQEMFPVKCVHCGESVWPPDHNWRFVHKWCVEENALTRLFTAAETERWLVKPTIERAPQDRAITEQWRFYPTIEDVVDEAQLLESYQIGVLDLGNRASHCLQSAEIATVGELDSRTEEELLAIRNMGAGSVNEIQTKLHQFKNRMGSGDWDGPPPARHESQKSRQDWLQNLAPEDDVPLEDLGLDLTLVSFLEGNDIRGVAQLVSRTEEELMAIRHLGSGKAAKIRAGLERFGWRLGEVSSFPTGRSELRSALADQAQQAEYKQREAKGLVWPLVSDGSSIDRIVESTGLSEAAVREARNAWMVEQRIAGASNRTIGETVGMSAEAVRRSIKRAGNLDSGHIRELRAARLEGSIRDT